MDEMLIKDVSKLRKSLERTIKLAKTLEEEAPFTDESITEIGLMKLVENLEINTVHARKIPTYNVPAIETDGRDDLDVAEENKVRFGTVGDGIEYIAMPRLLPHRSTSSVVKKYFNSIYYPQFRAHYKGKDSKRVAEKQVLWFVHNYNYASWDRGMRDHSNTETKLVEDMLTPFLLTDDNPKYCDILQTSVPGPEDKTIIYLVPYSKFSAFFGDFVENYAEATL